MIFISKSGYLKYKNLTFKCALGKAGIGNKKEEGDNITPKGTFKVIKIYYRKDRIKKLISQLRPIQIKKNMGWCDDPSSKFYNRLIKLPSASSYEKLYRKDNLYNIIIVLNYNMKPIIKGKGSAIFIHVTKKNYKTTQGCLALKQKDLITLVGMFKKNQKIKII
jgi:L,D-peptidoglycan transpeptidase YkuD (ErfK/YbiS/YcfS/YnhG family)